MTPHIQSEHIFKRRPSTVDRINDMVIVEAPCAIPCASPVVSYDIPSLIPSSPHVALLYK